MKTLTSLALTLALTGTATAAWSGEYDELALSVCRAELEQDYGPEVRIDLVNKRRFQHGSRLKVAAHIDADNGYFATCWVDNADLAAIAEKRSRAMLATTGSAETPSP